MPKSTSKKKSNDKSSSKSARKTTNGDSPPKLLTQKAKDLYLKKKIKELNSLDNKLSTLKKGVAAFCLFIILLNVYHIKRLGTVSTDLSGLMNKYNETVNRMDGIKKK